ncbi:RNA polymerase sigma factor [Pelomicrobium sp.]|jgi:RNA polymerase sigma-70 factor (ECF subfamily)|uniref:RNA polymerase sigma factor n=1 Tax=Pelomicrobium sp. TaxID=2815319 RepID=UPI002FDCD0DD
MSADLARKEAAHAELSDLDIARRIAAGERRAFELLMRRHNRTLFRAARSILKEDAEAEDAVQEAYLLAYRAIGRFRGEARLSTWLVRIVINQALGRLRARSAGAAILPFDDGAAGACHEKEASIVEEATQAQPEHAAQRAELRRLLEAKIDALPAAYRTVFVLRALEEMTVEEIAACLDIPEATVRTRYFRARSLLRAALSREIDLGLEDVFAFAGLRCDRTVAAVFARLDTPLTDDI